MQNPLVIRERKNVSYDTCWIRKLKAHPIGKKCDAKQPCMTCVKKNKATACKYDGSRPSDNASAKIPMSPPKGVLLPWSDPGEPGSSHPLSHHSRERFPTHPGRFERDSSPLILETIVPIPSSVPGKFLGVSEHPLNLAVSSLTILPSIHFRSIPCPLKISLPPERVQVSWVSASDQDMTLCVFLFYFVSFLRVGAAECAILAAD